eukprot:SAG31_NODE_703_length_12720_cov_10.185088_14_plen_122_part_00
MGCRKICHSLVEVICSTLGFRYYIFSVTVHIFRWQPFAAQPTFPYNPRFKLVVQKGARFFLTLEQVCASQELYHAQPRWLHLRFVGCVSLCRRTIEATKEPMVCSLSHAYTSFTTTHTRKL